MKILSLIDEPLTPTVSRPILVNIFHNDLLKHIPVHGVPSGNPKSFRPLEQFLAWPGSDLELGNLLP